MLPKFEVIIPEVEPDVRRDSAVEVVQEPGLYVLQAGSFTKLTDADRRRAQLALEHAFSPAPAHVADLNQPVPQLGKHSSP